MKKIKLFLIIIAISLFFSGCVDENVDVTPAVTETRAPTTPVITANPTPETTPVRQSVLFKSDVDNYYGFFRTVKIGPEERAVYDYKNRTLTIYSGDTVT